ncbi:hypothetical protein [Sphingomonas alpina]|uniref:SMI1/KNR4 family protein n=1 Tax=Sphingomonas alpina TaxID=653931 RepID=A0A7H0LIR1_9SPHN|nr:hypothetical protein [Sphingomonas alpina]QNQ09564.1 hypothetical protein H3Z74_23545 [Sphingomonas alpina]
MEFTLDSSLRLYCYSLPARKEDMESLLLKYPELPGGYEDLTVQATGTVFLWNEKGQLRIWGPEEALAMNAAYNVDEYAPGALAFADNGAGEILLYGTGLSGLGVYIVETGSIALDSDAAWVSRDLNGILLRADGAELIFQSDPVDESEITEPFLIESELR